MTGIFEGLAATVPFATAAASVAKVKIKKTGDVRKAEIAAETERLKIDSEERRAAQHEGAEIIREAIRVQTTPPAVPPGPTAS